MSVVSFGPNFTLPTRCGVCLEDVGGEETQLYVCNCESVGHVFHSKCIQEWIDVNGSGRPANARCPVGNTLSLGDFLRSEPLSEQELQALEEANARVERQRQIALGEQEQLRLHAEEVRARQAENFVTNERDTSLRQLRAAIQGTENFKTLIESNPDIPLYYDQLSVEEFVALRGRVRESFERSLQRSLILATLMNNYVLRSEHAGEVPIHTIREDVDEILAGVPVPIRSHLRQRPPREEREENTRRLLDLDLDEYEYDLSEGISHAHLVVTTVMNNIMENERIDCVETVREFRNRIIRLCASALNTLIVRFEELSFEGLGSVLLANLRDKYYEKHRQVIFYTLELALACGNSDDLPRAERGIFLRQCNELRTWFRHPHDATIDMWRRVDVEFQAGVRKRQRT